MKKVAILTITNSGLNFGNRLQNYALQEALKKQGLDVETIVSSKSIKNSKLLSVCRRNLKIILKNDKRRKLFNKFNKKYINIAPKIRYEGINESDFATMYDAFIAGSDQVWNPNFHFNSSFEFASFAPMEKRFSYAASIGVSEIKEEHKEEFIQNLKGMKQVSVRENDSIPLIQKLTGREAQVHVDPTMLLTKEEYYKIEEMPPQGLPEKYILVYFLGKIPYDYQKKIQLVVEAYNLPVVELSESRNSIYYNVGPQNFLFVINHAEYICTDSFHGSVFSILFNKQFTTFIRNDNDEPMNSRIETLFSKFCLQDRLVDKNESDIIMKEIDYVKINLILENERKKSNDYLNKISNMIAKEKNEQQK